MTQRPLELILARNLMSALSTPAFLVDEGGEPIPYDELPVVRAVRSGRPAHAEYTIRSTDGAEHSVEVSAFPILTAHGSQGGIAIFWPQGANGSGAA